VESFSIDNIHTRWWDGIVEPGLTDDQRFLFPRKWIRLTLATQQSNEQAARNPVTLGIAAFAAISTSRQTSGDDIGNTYKAFKNELNIGIYKG
jgi:hypothetical protein